MAVEDNIEHGEILWKEVGGARFQGRCEPIRRFSTALRPERAEKSDRTAKQPEDVSRPADEFDGDRH
jgi:hypothetical protein